MSKPIQAPDVYQDMPFPVAGIDTAAQFEQQRVGTAFDAQNVQAYEALTQRGRGGSRPGLGKYVTDQIADSVIQMLEIIVDPAADALAANFDVPVPLFTDTSTNNVFVAGGSIDVNLRRVPAGGRTIREGGSGVQHNRHRPTTTQKKVPVIQWSDPADIAQHTLLAGAQLNAQAVDPFTEAPVAGTYDYDPPAGTSMDTIQDDIPLNVEFTPTDTVTYRSKTKTVHIDVVEDMIETHIVVTDIGSFSDLTPVLNFTFADGGGVTCVALDPDDDPVAGSFVFTPAMSDTMLTSITNIHVAFTPTDPGTYEGSTLDIPVEITHPDEVGGDGTITGADGSDPVAISDITLATGYPPTIGQTVDGPVDALFDDDNPGVTPFAEDIGNPITARYVWADANWLYFYPGPP